MKKKRKQIKDKNRIPSKTSPKGGNRGCLCEDNTYHKDCCDGSLHSQGIGKV